MNINPLIKNEARAYWISLDIPQAEVEALRSLLSVDEDERAQKFVFEIHRNRFIVARACLRLLLSHFLGIRPEDLRFEYNEYGKPQLAPTQYANLEFNLSHSEHLAAYAFTYQIPIGIDIEFMKPDLAFDEIAERFFSLSEFQKLQKVSQQMKCETFFNAWTRKEALLKALGEGLSFPLRDCEVSLLPDEKPQILSIKGDMEKAGNWTLQSSLPFPSFKMAIVTHNPDAFFTVMHLHSHLSLFLQQ